VEKEAAEKDKKLEVSENKLKIILTEKEHMKVTISNLRR